MDISHAHLSHVMERGVMLSERHRTTPSIRQSTSEHQLHANTLAVWGDPYLSTICLSVMMDDAAISADVIFIHCLACNTHHKSHEMDDSYFSLAVMYHEFNVNRDFSFEF